MARKPRNEYAPDHVTPPGETLAETLSALGMSPADLARQTGKDPALIDEIIKGQAAITPSTARLLERVLGVPASFWNNRQKHYDDFLASRQAKLGHG